MDSPAPYSLKQLADYIDADIEGDKDCMIDGLGTLKDAQPKQLAFYANSRYKNYLAQTSAGGVILRSSERNAYAGNKLIMADPYLGYARLTALFVGDAASSPAIHPTATIAGDVKLGADISIGPNVVIEGGSVIGSGVTLFPGCYIGKNVVIGDDTIIYANASLYDGVSLGQHCIVHSGAVIGSDGFGFAPSQDGWQKIYQLGSVEIGNGVEVGANTTIDRGALGNTVIADGVKIDNQVQVAHNVEIGEQTAIAAAAAIAGSTVIGKRCTIAGAVGIVGHLAIVDDVHVTAMTMVTKSILHSGSYSSGVPMNETRQWRKNAVRFNQLDSMARQLKLTKK